MPAIHITADTNTKKSVLNTGSTACQMLVVLITPPQE